MEKLIELLKESGKADEICPTGIDIRKQYFDAGNITRADRMMYEYLCSKHFGFIKRLVEKDKINTRNLNLQVFMSMFSNDGTVEISYEELILMLLAISDEPLELLISILK